MNTPGSFRITRSVGAAAAAAWALPIALIEPPSAAADPCPDVEVGFARGTTEPPGVGGVGQAFVDSLRSQLGARSVGVYAVDYPATRDFVRSARAGAGLSALELANLHAHGRLGKIEPACLAEKLLLSVTA